MIRLSKIPSARCPTLRIGVGIIMSSVIAMTALAGSAAAEGRWGGHEGYRHNWNGGYYRSPPVIYGSPYYYPPPIVYGPGIGLNFNIR